MDTREAVTVRDREAFLAKLGARIRGFATYLGMGRHADDIAQETLLILSTRYGDVIDSVEIIKLANRICRNVASNLRRKEHEGSQIPITDSLGVSSIHDNPEEIIFRREVLAMVQNSDARCKRLVHLKLLGATSAEICQELRVTPNTLYSIQFRCWQRLKGALGWNPK